MGDSCTWGYLLEQNKTYPAQLQSLLSKHCSGNTIIEVINAGVPGYSSFQGLQYLRKIIGEIDPDLVTIYFGRNDRRLMPPEWQGRQDCEQAAHRGIISSIQGYLKHLKIYQLNGWIVLTLRNLFPENSDTETEEHLQPDESPLEDTRMRVSADDYADNIRKMVRLTEDAGATPFLLTTPVNPHTIGNYNDVLKRTAVELDAHLLDIAADFEAKGVSAYLFDDCHPNPEGNRLIAEKIYNQISRMVRSGSHPLATLVSLPEL
jgi:lysophospholipase L1-like esterase